MNKLLQCLALFFFLIAKTTRAQNFSVPIKISGVYPHLAVFNEGNGITCTGNGAECGIGAVVPWAGKLWLVTYSPHCPGGSSDKLYSIDKNLKLVIHPESVGGTPANRLIHKESEQLIIGPYLIDSLGRIRVIPPSSMPGRLTATARHLTDPSNKVYFFDMEGMLYEANVHSLAVKKLFHKPVPGWHGKGGYTAQKQLIISNNGERKVFDIDPKDLQAGAAPKTSEDMGVLATWNGEQWKIIERKQFTDVTGPGGIYGAPNDVAPAWAIGWDRRSVILKLLDAGEWYTYRLPKSTHTYDHSGGWYTEWPRIRQVSNNLTLMDMHGLLYDFPKTFSRKNSAGITPLSTHLRYIPDFTGWNGKIVIATDETSILQNRYAGRSQSNLWFGSVSDIKQWGAPRAWGGPWMQDSVKAGNPSDAFLMRGFAKTVLHLSHQQDVPLRFILEIDQAGNNQWKTYRTITVDANSYSFFIFPQNFSPNWIRIKTDADCIATAFFHFNNNKNYYDKQLFSSIADVGEERNVEAALIRPAGHNKNLQVLHLLNEKNKYMEVNEKLQFVHPAADSTAQLEYLLKLEKDFDFDNASVIVRDSTGAFRLPKTSKIYDHPFTYGWPRGKRELESERFMLNAHGTFYEVGRESGYEAIRPIATHKKSIVDFCTWRGLLVISGTRKIAKKDGHYFRSDKNNMGLWFGAIDDLWKLGKPVGEGGVWKDSEVKANTPSLPYLMTGYDKKKTTLTADKDVTITLEVNIDHNGWHPYKKIKLSAHKTVQHIFPDGFSAHWIRATSDKDCKATIWFNYE